MLCFECVRESPWYTVGLSSQSEKLVGMFVHGAAPHFLFRFMSLCRSPTVTTGQWLRKLQKGPVVLDEEASAPAIHHVASCRALRLLLSGCRAPRLPILSVSSCAARQAAGQTLVG